jgi:hypothetical protein
MLILPRDLAEDYTMGTESKPVAILVLTHFIDASIIAMFQRLNAETPEDHDVFLVFNSGADPAQPPSDAAIFGDKLYIVHDAKLFNPVYSERCGEQSLRHELWRKAGSADLMVLCFALEHQHYQHIWGVEYDVHFQGLWSFFFDRFAGSNADLIGTLLGPMDELPANVQAMPPAFHDEAGNRPASADAIAGFFPIFRMSRAFLKMLDGSYRNGWNGHYEYTLGTLAQRHAMTVEDIGGDGPFVRPHNKNAFYFASHRRWDKSPGTFVFRPELSSVRRHENTLWHPVKPNGVYFNHAPPAGDPRPLARIKASAKAAYYHAAITAWFWFKWRPASRPLVSK